MKRAHKGSVLRRKIDHESIVSVQHESQSVQNSLGIFLCRLIADSEKRVYDNRANTRKLDTAKTDLKPSLAIFGGQGVRREAKSEGHEEKYRAVIEGCHPEDELVGLCQEALQSACCAEDEGRSFGVVLQEKAPNSHELLQLKAVVVNVMEKA